MKIPLKCSCGSLRGEVEVDPTDTVRCICLCDDCQAYAHWLGRAADLLDGNGGTDICPVRPAHLKLSVGTEHLRCLRLSEKGMYRWFAGCCKTPIANSMPFARVPFAGMPHLIMDHAATGKSRDALVGPLQGRVLAGFGIPPLPPDSHRKAPLGVILRTLSYLVRGFLRKEHRPSPFFDETGKPRVAPTVLSPQERDALRPLCGPTPLER